MGSYYDECYEKLKRFNQVHLLNHYKDLNEEQKLILLQQISNLDLSNVMKKLKSAKALNENKNRFVSNEMIQPIPDDVLTKIVDLSSDQLDHFRNLGLKAIRSGNVAAILMSGGKGTRLGSSLPKGMFDIGLKSGKTLFQIQAERLKKVEELAFKFESNIRNSTIPWYIMTSEQTNESTKQYFKENQYFGLNETNVIFFQQKSLPCFDHNDKIILKSSFEIATAPNGNGGLYEALIENGIIDDFITRNIQYVHVYGVDNILIKIADPIFIGFAISKNADCAVKVVEKTIPTEAVGVICQINKKFYTVEYSEISEELANERCKETNDLVYNAGNIANHFFHVEFLKEVLKNHVFDLPIHLAFKNILSLNNDKVSGVQMEQFIFDILPYSKYFAALMVLRGHEFSPLKNNLNVANDNANTCKRDLYNLHRFYLEKAGAIISENSQSNVIEISPSITYDGENLINLVAGKVFTTPIYLT